MKFVGKQTIVNTIAILTLAGLLFFTTLTFAQEQFKMDENTYQQFTRAKRMFEKGKVFFLKKNYKKSEPAFSKCIETFPQYSQADYFLAQICYNRQDYINALKHIENAKKNFGFMTNLLISSQHKYLDQVRTELQNRKSRLVELTLQSEIERAKKDISDLEARLKEPIPVLPSKSAAYYYFHGNILMKLKKFNDAHAQYMEALKISPTHGNASNNLASLYYMIKKYQKAMFYLKQAEANGVKINPEFKKALMDALKGQ